MSYRRGYYKKDGTYVKGHYVSKNTKPKTQSKKKFGCVSILTIFIVIFCMLSCEETDSGCESKKCSDFNTQPEAQLFFNDNPNCYRNLDKDDDDIPCENLPN
jgi:hypothetical protein